jgi:excisionase family DNA binding protein
MEKLLTLEEAAEIMKVSHNTMRAWLMAGKIKGAKVGKLWRIKPSDLEAFLQESMVHKEQEAEK